MDWYVLGKNARKRRTVVGDELLKFLKVEFLLSARSTHFLYSNLFVRNLPVSALRCEHGKTHYEVDLWIQKSVRDIKCLPIDLCDMQVSLLNVGY